MTQEQLNALIKSAGDVPPAPLVQTENDLHPDPARLAWEIRLLRNSVDELSIRVAQLERDAHVNRRTIAAS